jgi:hypothetical protein
MGDYFGVDTWHSSLAMITDDEVYDAITHNRRLQPVFDNELHNHNRLVEGVTRIYAVPSLAALKSEQASPNDVRLVLGDGLYYAVADSTTPDDGYFAIRSSVNTSLLWRFSSGFRVNNPGGFVVLSLDGKIPPQLLPYTSSQVAIVDMNTAGKLSDTIGPGYTRELVRGAYQLTDVRLGDVCNVRSKSLMITNYSAYAAAYLALFYSFNGGANTLLETLTVPSGGSDPFRVFSGFDATVASPGAGTLRFSIQAAAAPDANLNVTAVSDSASLGTIQIVREVAQ